MKKILLTALFFIFSPALVQAESCHTITEKQDLFDGYGAAWNVFSNTFDPLATAECGGTTVDISLGQGTNSEIIWHEAYYTQDGTEWLPLNLPTAGKWTQSDNWYLGDVSASVTMTADELKDTNYIAFYHCLYTDEKEWKCGCEDAETCDATGVWNIQSFSYEDTNEEEEEEENEEEENTDPATCNQPLINGTTGTWYEKDENAGGACGFHTDQERMGDYYVAMNGEQWENSSHCGGCVEVTGENGSVVAMVTDLCPADDDNPLCRTGHLDLSPATFQAAIGDTEIGYAEINWRFVPCDTNNDPVTFHFQPGSHNTWTSVQVRNATHRIKSIEFKNPDNDEFTATERTDYGFFVGEDRGAGPYTLRVTDIYDQVITEENIELIDGGYIEGENQFPACVE